MKKILIYILLLANLGAGLAFAWDSHPEGVVGHDTVVIDWPTVAGHDHSDDDLDHADHCCHGAAHLVGLIFSQGALLAARSDYEFFMFSRTPNIRYISPLLRPPIV
ncbi:hypothetical protein MNBD_GAMMA16-610 [hydrothermal vent metagenome]|uniref:DUF2946 domain-containing protein n=1 Tax=hydrothermal vent metagenome TaxID=652676 RepID=A0A3B0ZZY3_9ZZZZ